MPFVLILLGTTLFVAGIRNTQGVLLDLLKGDLTGPDSFLVWIAAIAVVGGLGYIPKLRPLSIAFMTLLLLVLVIKDKGVFAQLASFVKNPMQTTVSGVVTNSANAPSAVTTGLAPIQPLAPLSATGVTQ